MPDVLFAPWRYEYLVSDKSGNECFLCEAAASEQDAETLIVYRGRKVFVILNRYPYTNGHVMVAPYGHEARLSESSSETRGELVETGTVEQVLLDPQHEYTKSLLAALPGGTAQRRTVET